MNRVPRARYTKELREEAVKLAEAVGAPETSRRLAVPLKSLANWQRAAKAGKLEEVGPQQKRRRSWKPSCSGPSGSWLR